MTLGMSNNSLNLSLIGDLGSSRVVSTSSNVYGEPVGTIGSHTNTTVAASLGVTTDATKSGLIVIFSGLTLGTITSLKLGNYYIRY